MGGKNENKKKRSLGAGGHVVTWVTSENVGEGAGSATLGPFTLAAGVIPGIKIDFSPLPAPARH